MKRRFTILTAAIALLAFLAIPMGVWGQTTTEEVTLSSGTFSTDHITWTCASGNITIQQLKGNSTTAVNSSYISAPRMYKQHVLSFVGADGYTITKIDIKCDGSYYGSTKYAGTAITNNDVANNTTALNASWSTTAGGTHTIETVSNDGLSEIYIQNGHSSDGNTQLRFTKLIVTYKNAGGTFTVTYDCNGGEIGCPANVSDIEPGASITLADAPTRNHFNFNGWKNGETTYEPGDSYMVNSSVTFIAQWESDGTFFEGSICFSNQSSCTAINSQSVTGDDDLGNTWTITTVGTSSFTANSGYYQVGSGNSPASSITFTTTFDEEVNVTDFSATFGGFNATRASVVLKVDNTQVGSGSLNGSADVTVSSSSAQTGTTLTVIVTPTAGGVKCYNISYGYETIATSAVATTTTINVPANFNTDIYQGTSAGTLSAIVTAEGNALSGATVTWSSSNTGVATIDANGAVTLVSVGTTTITASYAGVEDEYRPSEGTYELTVTDSNAPGTENNPYTVAQAIYAIDNNGNVNGVYATGIVSQVDYYSENNHYITYYISADGSTTGQQLEAFHGKNINGADFSSINDIQVGDIVVIYGNLTKYNSTYEFAADNQLVSLEHPQNIDPSVTVSPATINAPFAGAEGTLALTYENIEEFISFDYYFCDAEGEELEEDPDWIYAEIQEEDEEYSLYYLIDANDDAARTAYLKVYTFDDNFEEVYAIVTVNQAEYVVDYAELPFEFNGGKADIATTNGLTQNGLGSDYSSAPKLKFDGDGDYVILKINERPGILTFNIKGNSFSGGTFKVQTSEDGVTYTDLETYTELGTTTQIESFDNLGENVRYIKWIYTEKSSGNVALGNITLAKYVEPVLVASITVDPDEVNVDAAEHDGTLTLISENLVITIAYEDFGIQFYDAEESELNGEDEPDWIDITAAEEQDGSYVVSYYMLENEGEARTAYFKVFAMGDEDFVYSNLVTINQAAPVVPPTPGSWVLTSLADLTEDDIFVIVGTYEDDEHDSYALPYDGGTSSSPSAVAVTVVDNTLSGEPAANIQWNLGITDNGYIFYPNGTTESWLYCTNTNTGLHVGTSTSNVFIMSEEGYLQNDATGRYIGIYNAQDWRCYTNTTGNIAGQTFAFYKKVDEPITETYTLEITGYEEGSNGGYYLIASPVTVDPATVDGMTSGDFDLYYYDESNDNEWRNYEANAFNLEPGKGYLYAKQATTEGEVFNFTLTGTPYAGNGTVELDYNEDSEFPGFNLIGNPFGTNATLNMPYYRLNSDRSGLNTSTETTEINVMEGVFVEATAEIQTATFSTGAKRVNQLNIKVTRNRGTVLDNAIIRFDNGATLGKFQINQNSTKLYITEGNQDYAVVCSNNEGEMPVNFKAAENGNYTLSVDAENVEVSYLHLIDNMNNADIDLLATPSYSFDARTTDNANRFRLVFNTNGVDENTTTASFAYFNGSEWTINNMGEATLQIVDLMGRVLSTQAISGNTEVSISQVPGVYMLRLINGENVMVQKVVVR